MRRFREPLGQRVAQHRARGRASAATVDDEHAALLLRDRVAQRFGERAVRFGARHAVQVDLAVGLDLAAAQLS